MKTTAGALTGALTAIIFTFLAVGLLTTEAEFREKHMKLYIVLHDYNYGYEDHADDVFCGVYTTRAKAVARARYLAKTVDPTVKVSQLKRNQISYSYGTPNLLQIGTYHIKEVSADQDYE